MEKAELSCNYICWFGLIFSGIIVFLSIICLLIMAWKRKDFSFKDAISLSALSLIFLALTNIDKINKLTLGDVGIEWKEIKEEANATIEQLKNLALTLSTSTYDDLAMHGQIFRQISFEHRYENKKKIDAALKELGATPEEINQASDLWKWIISYQMMGLIFREETKLSDTNQIEAWEKIIEENQKKEAIVPVEEIKSFVEKNNLSSDLVNSRIDDYEKFLETGEIRHPELWTAGYVGP